MIKQNKNVKGIIHFISKVKFIFKRKKKPSLSKIAQSPNVNQ